MFNSLANCCSREVRSDQCGEPKTRCAISATLSNALAGNRTAGSILLALTRVPIPFVRLNKDPCDASSPHLRCPAKGHAPVTGCVRLQPATLPTLNEVLTDEQEALLGCGEFYGTDCEVDGVDLANVEASVFHRCSALSGAYSP